MSKLLEALRGAKQSDLDEVEKKLAALESEAAGLREVQKILRKLLGVEQPKNGERRGSSDAKRQAILECLRKAGRPLSASAIAQQTSLSGQAVGLTCSRMPEVKQVAGLWQLI